MEGRRGSEPLRRLVFPPSPDHLSCLNRKGGPNAYTAEEHAAIGADYRAVSATPSVTSGPSLGLPAKGTTVRITDGEAVTTEGPYAGVAHALGGFTVLDAASLGEAVALAARIPAARLGGAVEVRPCEVYW